MNLNEEHVLVLLACPSCQWSGKVVLYDIGDGPEWCCPSCDMCFPATPVVGDDGLTVAERELRRLAAWAKTEQTNRWNSDQRSGIVPDDERSP